MLKWAASLSAKVASSVTDTFAPLFRSPLEQLQDAWRAVESDCQSIMLRSAEEMDDPRLLLDSQLVHHLNQLVEALVKEEEEQAARTQNTHALGADGDYGGSSSSSDSGVGGSSPFDGLGGKDASKSATGPCFEYFLNEKILDRLCALGLPDVSAATNRRSSHRTVLHRTELPANAPKPGSAHRLLSALLYLSRCACVSSFSVRWACAN